VSGRKPTGRPPGRPRIRPVGYDYKRAKKPPQTALTLVREENIALQPRKEDGSLTSRYSDQDKQLAVTLYAITDSPTRAGEWWRRIKGEDTCPGTGAIKRWEEEDGVATFPSEEAVNALKAVYKGRYLDQEIQTFELAQEAVRRELKEPSKAMFNVNGILMTVAERTRLTLFPAQREGTNIINAPGARFNVGQGYQPPTWEGEAKEVKEVEE